MRIEVDEEFLDEVWPQRKTLVGLEFATEAEYQRAVTLAQSWGLDYYKELYPEWRMIVVRKGEAERFIGSGLAFTEIEQVDDEDLDPEEVRRRDEALIEYWKPIVRERMRQR